VYVCDVREERAREIAAKLGCEATTDYRGLLRRPDVAAVLVAVPNGLHYATAMAAVKAGKHVAVEYPVCQTVAQFGRLAAAAARRNLVVADLLTPVLEPQPLAMRKAADRIGRIMSMRSAYFAGISDSWYVREDVRGSFYAALTIHQIIYYNVVVGAAPDWVEAALHTHVTPAGRTCCSGMYMCHYPGGTLGFNDWGMGFDDNPFVWEWVIEGAAGRLVYERPAGAAHRGRVQKTGQPDELLEIEPQRAVHAPFVDNFVAQVLDRAEALVCADTTCEVLQLCEAALTSARRGRRVYLRKQA
jgi:predicted dehydrogenase